MTRALPFWFLAIGFGWITSALVGMYAEHPCPMLMAYVLASGGVTGFMVCLLWLTIQERRR